MEGVEMFSFDKSNISIRLRPTKQPSDNFRDSLHSVTGYMDAVCPPATKSVTGTVKILPNEKCEITFQLPKGNIKSDSMEIRW